MLYQYRSFSDPDEDEGAPSEDSGDQSDDDVKSGRAFGRGLIEELGETPTLDVLRDAAKRYRTPVSLLRVLMQKARQSDTPAFRAAEEAAWGELRENDPGFTWTVLGPDAVEIETHDGLLMLTLTDLGEMICGIGRWEPDSEEGGTDSAPESE